MSDARGLGSGARNVLHVLRDEHAAEEEEARSHWRRALKAKPELANGYFE